MRDVCSRPSSGGNCSLFQRWLPVLPYGRQRREDPGRAKRYHQGFADFGVRHRRHAVGFSPLHRLSIDLLMTGWDLLSIRWFLNLPDPVAFRRFSSQTLDVYQRCLNFWGGLFLLCWAPSICPALGFDKEVSWFALHESLCWGESGLPGECLVTRQSSCKNHGEGGGRDQLLVPSALTRAVFRRASSRKVWGSFPDLFLL